MEIRSMTSKSVIGAAALVAGIASAAGLWSFDDAAAQNIQLQGIAAQNCTIDVTADAAASTLPLTTAGAQRIQVGTVTQTCNKKAGYTLSVTSSNCAAAPTGGKVVDAVAGEHLSYSGEFANPTTGGSTASVTGLLASACSSQVARDVTNAKISGEISTVFVNFTGDAALGAGTYTDTLTVVLAVK